MALNGIAEYFPTTHIIYHEEDDNGNSQARMVDLQTGHVLQRNVAFCSSSMGILLIHRVAVTGVTGTYLLCNPFLNNVVKPLPFNPPPHHPLDSSYAVVGVEGSTFDVVFLKRLPYNDGERYEAALFSSDKDSCFTMDIGIFMRGRTIQPNSGVSCRRNAYFLIDSISILKIDIVSREYSCIFMPIRDISIGDTVKAQLGSAWGKLGLVVANESKLWIKVYLRIQISTGVRIWMDICTVKVELENDCDDVTIIQDGEGLIRTIRCKEMPRPVRFESLRLQVPLWVDGRIVMVESVNGNVLLRRIDCQIPPSCAASGMSYVKSRARLLYQIVS